MDRESRPELLDAALRDLTRINRVFGGLGASLDGLSRSILDIPRRERAVEVLDVAAGSGDLGRALARWGRRHDRRIGLTLLDRNPSMLAWSRSAGNGTAASYATCGAEALLVRRVVGDAAALPFPDGAFDVSHCALFLHHLDPDHAIRVLTEMARVSRHAVVVNDLHRGRCAIWLTWLATRFFRSPLVRFDGPLSVRKAYTLAEARALVQRMGGGLTLRLARRRFPFRMVLVLSGATPAPPGPDPR